MEDTANSSGRSKRQKIDRHGRFAALQKLKELKGSKHKYEITRVENVYEEIDEREYSKKVLARQEDDWIVDDDGCGYVEDGREIFDDDLDEESIEKKSKEKSSRKRGRSKLDAPVETGKALGNIRNLIANMPVKKKKEATVKLSEDDILGDIMQEIDSTMESSPKTISRRNMPIAEQETAEDEYLRSFEIKPKAISVSLKRKITPIKTRVKEEENVDEMNIQPLVSPPVVVKEEPVEDMSQLVEEFDSNDGFLDSTAFSDMDMQIEEVESQQSQAKVIIKEEPQVEIKKTDVRASTEEQLLSGVLWKSENNEAIVSINWDTSKLPLTTVDDSQVLQFFYWDAYEDATKQPGTVYLFGKVWIESASAYVSCCVAMKNIERRIFLLPREERVNLKTGESTGEAVTMLDVYEEFNTKITTKYNIHQFRSRKATRYYSFQYSDVPLMSEYLEVKYAPNLPMLPKDLQGETFSRVFGTTSSFLELLLLQRKIKGPCWLQLANPQCVQVPVSWCKVEAVGQRIEDISIATFSANALPPPPPLVVVTLSTRHAVNSKTQIEEIIMISCLVQNKYHIDKSAPNPLCQQHFCAMTRPSEVPFPFDLKDELSVYHETKVERCDTERALLAFFVAKLGNIDPDVVVGHDLQGGDIDAMLHRFAVHRIPNWSRLGRLRRAALPTILKGKLFSLPRIPLCGRLICDIKISGKELIRARSYDLTTLCETVLKTKEGDRVELTTQDIKGAYSSGKTLKQLISNTMKDAAYISRLMYEMNVLPLALQITNIAGNVMSRTLMGGRSERNEFLLLHAFTEKNYIVPDKIYGKALTEEAVDPEDMPEEGITRKKSSSKKKPAYAGGLVLEPKVGFYDKLILLMDFNSLYPSIILEYNICFTTTTRVITDSKEPDSLGVELPEANVELGILPTELRKLIESRRDVKKLMKKEGISSDLKLQYNIRQMALKLTANSMYGCLGFSNSRFYAKALAALVTCKGREILTNTQDLVQKLNYEVIYGDTDSIMINTNSLVYDDVFKIGNKIKSEVNRLYKHVELDIDGVFKYMLLLKKKKYAAVTISKQPNGEFILANEMKGLDIVRRDWSQLSAEAGKFILAQILSDQDYDERLNNIQLHLNKLKDDLEQGKVPLSLLTIAKQLSKAAEEYSDKKTQPHVMVALRLNSSDHKTLRAGDTVHYVICEDGTNNPATQRAYHVDELKQSETLKIDYKYYLAHQIHPVISRLCNPIEGIDEVWIAECLGLDPTSYKRSLQRKTDEETGAGDKPALRTVERFKNCDKFSFKCINPKCSVENIVDSPVRKNESGGPSTLVLQKCVNPECTIQPLQYLPYIQNKLTLSMRLYIQKFYKGWLICEDPACTNRTTKLPLHFVKQFPVCYKCERASMYREYTEKDLYTQLCYFQHIFDATKLTNKMSIDTYNAYSKLHEHVGRTLNQSRYSVINLSYLFRNLGVTGIPIKQEPST